MIGVFYRFFTDSTKAQRLSGHQAENKRLREGWAEMTAMHYEQRQQIDRLAKQVQGLLDERKENVAQSAQLSLKYADLARENEDLRQRVQSLVESIQRMEQCGEAGE